MTAGGADIRSIRGSFQKHDVEAGMMKLVINRKDKVYTLLETIIDYKRLDKDIIGNVVGCVRKY